MMTVQEVSSVLKISEEAVREWIHVKDLRAIKFGREWRIAVPRSGELPQHARQPSHGGVTAADGAGQAFRRWRMLVEEARKAAPDRAVSGATPASDVPTWHALTTAEAEILLGERVEGLTDAEARERRLRFGPNSLPPPKTRGPLRRFPAQFNNLLIQVLMGVAAITAALGHWTDFGVILAVCVLNATVGFIQEGKAEQALNAIRHMLSAGATVLRDGHRATLPAEELVSGDLVLLEAGGKVPSDLRLVWSKNLHVQEAALTGESLQHHASCRNDPSAVDPWS